MKRRRCSWWFALVLLVVVGCSKPKPGEQFLGKWLNSTERSKGTILIAVERHEDNFLVRKTFIDTGAIFEVNSGRVENGFLILGEDSLFKKLAYSERDDALLVLDPSLPIPPFRRVVQSAPSNPSVVKNAGAEYSAVDVAAGVTEFFQQNVPNRCDVKTAAMCAQSMEATTDGFTVHVKTRQDAKSIFLEQYHLNPVCSILEVAKAKLPTKLTYEVVDEHGGVAKFVGTCKPS